MWEWLILGVTSATAAIGAVWLLVPRGAKPGGALAVFRSAQDAPPVWLFEGQTLVDRSHSARALNGQGANIVGWVDLRDQLQAQFPAFPETPEAAVNPLIVESALEDDARQVVFEWLGEMVRVELRPRPASATHSDQPTADVLLSATKHAPYPVWRLDADNRVSWHNDAYSRLYAMARESRPEPSTPLFTITPDRPATGRAARKFVTVNNSNQKLWYDISVVPHGSGRLCYAVDVNAVVDAEVAQRNFVQTLAKTFAHLSIGLAIFDRNRQLVLFNPALIDLTALRADFLSGRPNVLSFFDRLRDQRMMPEPKNYSSWRQQMADLVAAAADGLYQETWSLPSGSVYSVTGRPHLDGAVAFLFEDITAEITLTRQFRADLELGQSILDQLHQAIAVFTIDGTLSFSNAAYHQLWGVDPDRSFAQSTILDATRLWQDHCRATPMWGEIRDFVAIGEHRTEWFGAIRLVDGAEMICSVYPINGGSTMVSFEESRGASLPALRQPKMQVIGA
ncbi:PAS-domain containing protein [Pontibaca salina]|uniref:PAS-domain containing protein n=1 Tax=Pontibaca salina TaxID=2795731 RepID=A0A934HRZ9_9RHOB|nr:PAS-domain containing protein [Pontibaca salina]MBI6629475.1 PAS-domain containing protein [Pontibaca salina]